MQFTMSVGGVPAGSYTAEFLGAEPYHEHADRFGEAVLLRFRVIGGEHDGAEASRICSAKLSPKSNLGKFAVALKGAPLQIGERFDPSEFVGLRGNVLVENTESGASRVAVFLRNGQPAAAEESN